MDGVFINISNKDVVIYHDGKEFTIKILKNIDLLTPVREIIKTNNTLSGIISTALATEDIHTIQSTQMFNTVYATITRSEQNIQMIPVTFINPYIKYPFTDPQIEKINNIANGRTRLLIMSKEDAEFWSNGNFECPFRKYRILVSSDNSLIEYPIPKTYRDSAVNLIKKITGV
jgi:hypothetical protein